MKQYLLSKKINTSKKIRKKDDNKFQHKCGNILYKHKDNSVKDWCGVNTRFLQLTNRGEILIFVIIVIDRFQKKKIFYA